MDPIAMLWAKRQMELVERADLRRLIIETREAEAKFRPIRDAYFAKVKARMRQDGPTGFVMVDA